MTTQDILLLIDFERLKVGTTLDGKITASYGTDAEFGVGKTLAEACEDYLNKCHRKTIVFKQ